MDDVDYRYKHSIREALQNGNIDKLMELIPSLTLKLQIYLEKYI